MSLWTPQGGSATFDPIPATLPASNFGTSVTSGASADTKGSWTTLVSSTAKDAVGIFIWIGDITGSQPAGCLMDIGIGTNILIPDLATGGAGDALQFGSVSFWYFPLYIEAGSQIQARTQSDQTSITSYVACNLIAEPRGDPGFVGSRVTAIGINNGAGASFGTDVTAGASGSYGTAVTLGTTPTGSAIKYLQMSMQPSGDATSGGSGGYVLYTKIIQGTGTDTLVSEIPSGIQSTEIVSTSHNAFLSKMRFNIPSGETLRMQTTNNTTDTPTHDWALYGVE